MKTIRSIFAERLLALACDGDMVHDSALARALRKMPFSFFVRLAKIAEGKA